MVDQAAILRRRVTPRPSRPRPTSAKETGSGVLLKSTEPVSWLMATKSPTAVPLPLTVMPWLVLLNSENARLKKGIGSVKKFEPSAVSDMVVIAFRKAPLSGSMPLTPVRSEPLPSKTSAPLTVTVPPVPVAELAILNVVFEPGSAQNWQLSEVRTP